MLPVSTGPVIIRSPVDSTIWTSLAAFILIISTMRAARYYGPGDMRIDEIPEPVAGEGQVKIKIAWNGICGSDVHSYFSLLPVSPTATIPHYVTKETLPVVMGHEFSGTITELGKGVDTEKFAVGDNVVAEPVISCMEPSCGPCSSGTRNICPHTTFIGIGGRGGGLAEYIAVDQGSVHVLPAGISLEIGALMEPLAVVWHAVKRSNFTAGDSVLIIGAGPIGLLLLKVLRALDASWVGVSEPASQRRDMALKLSASAAFDPLSDDIVSETARATDGRGAAVVFDCAGIQASLDTALAAVRARGNVVEVAVWETSPVLDIGALQKKEIILTASQSFSRVHSELLQAVAGGKLTGLEDLITRKIALEEFVDKGIKALIEEKDSQIKILVHP